MTAGDGAWWEGPGLERVLADLARGELARMRPDGGPGGENPLAEGGADSLERLRIAMAVARFLDLGEGDPDAGAPDAAGPDATRPDRSRAGAAASAGLAAAASVAALAAAARALLPRAGGGLAFATSGSLGAPREVRHPRAILDQEAEALVRVLGGPRPIGRVVAAVPAHHIYGFLVTVLLPHRLGVAAVDARAHAPASLPGLCREGDLVVAHPTLWAEAPAGRWPAGTTGVTSGAPCPPEVAARLRAGRLARLVEIYGSTETGGIGWRDADGAPYRLFDHWRREGEAIRRVLPGRDECPEPAIELPDHVAWEGERLLRPLARRDGAVQVAGVNVHPGRIRSVICAHPEVAAAAVRPMRADEGPWLKAFVVPRGAPPDAGAFRRGLDAWLRPRLAPAERPRSITLGPALPATAAGKPSDWIAEDDA